MLPELAKRLLSPNINILFFNRFSISSSSCECVRVVSETCNRLLEDSMTALFHHSPSSHQPSPTIRLKQTNHSAQGFEMDRFRCSQSLRSSEFWDPNELPPLPHSVGSKRRLQVFPKTSENELNFFFFLGLCKLQNTATEEEQSCFTRN